MVRTMAQTHDGVALLIPAYNAGTTLGGVLAGVRDTFLTIMVIDDGSRDTTAEVAKKAEVDVISHEHNRGKGAALRTGFRHLLERGFSVIMTMDADGQHSPTDIPHFLEFLDKRPAESEDRWGIVIGDRFWDRGDIPRYRYWPNRVGQAFLSLLTGQKMRDTQCGFRLYNATALRAVILKTNRFEFETEAILEVARAGFTLHFVPVTVIYPENEFKKTNFRPIVDTYRISILVLKSMIKTFAGGIVRLLGTSLQLKE